MTPSFRTLAAAAAVALAFVGMISADGSPPAAAAVGETVCACPPFGAAPRWRRGVPQSCRLCSGLVATNAGTGNLDVGAATGKKVVVTAPLVAESTLHIKDGTTTVDVLAELAQLRSAFGTLTARADTAEARADTAEARADTAEARADTAEARADTAEATVADLGASWQQNNKDVNETVARLEARLASDIAANTKGVADHGASINKVEASNKNTDEAVARFAFDVAANTKGVADLVDKIDAAIMANDDTAYAVNNLKMDLWMRPSIESYVVTEIGRLKMDLRVEIESKAEAVANDFSVALGQHIETHERDLAAVNATTADLGASIKNVDDSAARLEARLASDIAANTKGVADLGASIKKVDDSAKGPASDSTLAAVHEELVVIKAAFGVIETANEVLADAVDGIKVSTLAAVHLELGVINATYKALADKMDGVAKRSDAAQYVSTTNALEIESELRKIVIAHAFAIKYEDELAKLVPAVATLTMKLDATVIGVEHTKSEVHDLEVTMMNDHYLTKKHKNELAKLVPAVATLTMRLDVAEGEASMAVGLANMANDFSVALGQQIEKHERDLAAVNATTAVLETAVRALQPTRSL